MQHNRKYITVFEHQSLTLNQVVDGVKFDKDRFEALKEYYGEKGVPYYSLTGFGVRFNEYVGVIQVGDMVIEVLPKADIHFQGNEKKQWRDILINMLCAVGVFDIHAPSSSSLSLKPNAILELYFAMFLKEVRYLLHNGLVKKYRKEEGNVMALKGSLQFGKHIQQNLTHQERFYVKHTVYDVEHLLHVILYKAIRLIKQLNTSARLQSQIGALLLDFPEMPDLKITETTFDKLVFNRKTQSYQKAIEIARLLLLQYHPDLSRGRNNILALMFDMNMLWEQFVYSSLLKNQEATVSVTSQVPKFFWKPKDGYRSWMKADIVMRKSNGDCVVLDTKWKNLHGYNPSPDDLRQLYVYHEYYQAKRVVLVYPGAKQDFKRGRYLHPETGKEIDKECSIMSLAVEPNIHQWQQNIYDEFSNWLDLTSTTQ